MSSRFPIGWLPVKIGFDPQPAIVQEALVRWMEFGSTSLMEPFFHTTVEKLRHASPPAREIDTDIDALLRVRASLPAVVPSGFIFHLSHCGSTLVANALKTSPRAAVVCEHQAVSGVLRHGARNLTPYLLERWERTRRQILGSLFSLFAHYRTGEAEPLVVKFVSLDMLGMQWVRSYWPDVPCVIVVRDPVEVMVANLHIESWMAFKKNPEQALNLFGWTELSRPVEAMIDEEFCARVLGSFCASALAAISAPAADKCWVVDYLDLNPDRMREIASFFKIELAENGTAVEQVFDTYAKDPKKQVRFLDDRKLKQRLATFLVRSAADQWAMDGYAELRKYRRLPRTP